MNLTDTLTNAAEVVPQAPIPMFLNIVVWIGIVVSITLITIGSIRMIGLVAGIPTEKIFDLAKVLVERKLDQVKKNKNGNQKPFFLSMFGITIMAEGLTGRIMFIGLLGSIAAAGASIDSWIGLLLVDRTP